MHGGMRGGGQALVAYAQSLLRGPAFDFSSRAGRQDPHYRHRAGRIRHLVIIHDREVAKHPSGGVKQRQSAITLNSSLVEHRLAWKQKAEALGMLGDPAA